MSLVTPMDIAKFTLKWEDYIPDCPWPPQVLRVMGGSTNVSSNYVDKDRQHIFSVGLRSFAKGMVQPNFLYQAALSEIMFADKSPFENLLAKISVTGLVVPETFMKLVTQVERFVGHYNTSPLLGMEQLYAIQAAVYGYMRDGDRRIDEVQPLVERLVECGCGVTPPIASNLYVKHFNVEIPYSTCDTLNYTKIASSTRVAGMANIVDALVRTAERKPETLNNPLQGFARGEITKALAEAYGYICVCEGAGLHDFKKDYGGYVKDVTRENVSDDHVIDHIIDTADEITKFLTEETVENDLWISPCEDKYKATKEITEGI